MAKSAKGVSYTNIFLLVLSIFVLHVVLAYLVAICSNYLLKKYQVKNTDLFQVNTMSHTFVTIIDIMLIAAVLKYFL